MVVLNYTGEEINAKIVYYGPGLSGKTTNLESIYQRMPADVKGKMVSMKTRTDRTLFFDFLPLDLGEIGGYRARFLLYTVPGQVYYNATRKLVLKGADAVVFVADSARDKLEENIESLRNLEENLNEHGLSLDSLPWVIQYNKRDAANALTKAELDENLNLLEVPAFEAVATEGTGVYETFQGIAHLLYMQLKERLESGESVESISAGSAAEDTGAPSGLESGVENVDYGAAIDTALREVRPAGAAAPPSPASRKAPAPAPTPAPSTDTSQAPPAAKKQPAPTPPPTAKQPPPTNAPQPPKKPAPAKSPEPPVVPTGAPATGADRSPVSSASGEFNRRMQARHDDQSTQHDPVYDGEDFGFEDLEAGATESPAASPESGAAPRSRDASDTLVLEEIDHEVEVGLDDDSFITYPARPSRPSDESADDTAAADIPPPPEAEPIEVTVPVSLSRSQVTGDAPVKLVLEISVADD